MPAKITEPIRRFLEKPNFAVLATQSPVEPCAGHTGVVRIGR